MGQNASLVPNIASDSEQVTASNFYMYRVIDGWETLDDMEKVPVHEKTFRPTTDICIRRVTIHANPLA